HEYDKPLSSHRGQVLVARVIDASKKAHVPADLLLEITLAEKFDYHSAGSHELLGSLPEAARGKVATYMLGADTVARHLEVPGSKAYKALVREVPAARDLTLSNFYDQRNELWKPTQSPKEQARHTVRSALVPNDQAVLVTAVYLR